LLLRGLSLQEPEGLRQALRGLVLDWLRLAARLV
jgi:hypothetical protein